MSCQTTRGDKPRIQRGWVNHLWNEKPDGFYWILRYRGLYEQFKTWEEAMKEAMNKCQR